MVFDKSIARNTQEALEFITNILESSTEYSIIAVDLEGTIMLWNEGARRIYGYEAEEVVGKATLAFSICRRMSRPACPKNRSGRHSDRALGGNAAANSP